MEKIDSCSTLDLLFVLYSITDRSSFQEATLIIKYLLETKNFPASTIFLIASKADLKRHTEVTEFEGRLFAVNSGCLFHQLSNSDGFSEHCSIVRKAFLAVSSVGAQRPPKSPLIRRLKDGFKTKVYGGSSHDHVDRKRSASVEFWKLESLHIYVFQLSNLTVPLVDHAKTAAVRDVRVRFSRYTYSESRNHASILVSGNYYFVTGLFLMFLNR